MLSDYALKRLLHLCMHEFCISVHIIHVCTGFYGHVYSDTFVFQSMSRLANLISCIKAGNLILNWPKLLRPFDGFFKPFFSRYIDVYVFAM